MEGNDLGEGLRRHSPLLKGDLFLICRFGPLLKSDYPTDYQRVEEQGFRKERLR